MLDSHDNEGNLHANRRQRVREKFVAHGLDGFHDHEVLELLLYYCYPRQDTNKIAHRMIREFGSIQNLFDASTEKIVERLGCTEKIAVLLSLMPAIAKRYQHGKYSGKISLTQPQLAGEYAINLFIGSLVEEFYILCLDTSLRLNKAVKLSTGTIDEVQIFARELMRVVLDNNASHVILCHNHPGGITVPSPSDYRLTQSIAEILSVINVPVVDHIVIADDKYFSFSTKGYAHVEGY